VLTEGVLRVNVGLNVRNNPGDGMANDPFSEYLTEINKAYMRGVATEHTHRPALKTLIEALRDFGKCMSREFDVT